MVNCIFISISFLIKTHKAIGAHPTVMSKMLLPTELDTAMSPRPLRATITLVMRSGMDVPAASIVRPIISSEMPMVSPTYKDKPSAEKIQENYFLLVIAVFLNKKVHDTITLHSKHSKLSFFIWYLIICYKHLFVFVAFSIH